jgi:hypothetical protein
MLNSAEGEEMLMKRAVFLSSALAPLFTAIAVAKGDPGRGPQIRGRDARGVPTFVTGELGWMDPGRPASAAPATTCGG